MAGCHAATFLVGYETAIVTALLAAGIEVCVVQPARVRHFADAKGWLAKNDRIDARLLAAFGENIRPRLEVPASPESIQDDRLAGRSGSASQRQWHEQIPSPGGRRTRPS